MPNKSALCNSKRAKHQAVPGDKGNVAADGRSQFLLLRVYREIVVHFGCVDFVRGGLDGF